MSQLLALHVEQHGGEGDGAQSEGSGCYWAQCSRVHTSEKTPQNPEKWAQLDRRAQPCARGGFWLSFYALFCPPEGQNSHPSPVPRTSHPFSARRSYHAFPSRGGDRITCSTTEPLILSCITGINEELRKCSIIDSLHPKS